MNKFLSLSASSALLLSTFLITGCSGGDSDGGTSGITYDGNTSPAAIDTNNAEAIGKAAGESVLIADTSTNLPTAISVDTSVDLALVNNIILTVINSSNLPAGIDVSAEYCTAGGSATMSDSVPSASGELNTTITFSSCRTTEIDYDITLNGTVLAHVDNINDMGTTGTGYSFSYRDFTVIDHINGTSSTFNMTLACTNSVDFNTCTYSSDFLGGDGIVHRVAEFNISGDNITGYNGTATFFHGTHGEASITITNITYGDCGSYPVGGDISYSSTDGSSGTITFNGDCTASGTWDDGAGSSGSF